MGGAIQFLKEETRKCPIHQTPYDGICGDKTCYSSGLICLKCEPEACVVTFKHKLITIEEFYENFFKNITSQLDLKALKKMLEMGVELQNKQLELQVDKFEKWETELINQKLSQFKERIKAKIEAFQQRLITRLNEMDQEYKDANAKIDISTFEIPDNFTVEETTKIIDKNRGNVEELQKLIALIKKYSDNEKLLSNQKDLETIIYSKNLYDSISSTPLDEKLKVIKMQLSDLLSLVLSKVFVEKEPNELLCYGDKRFVSNPNKLVFKQDISIKSQKSYTIDSVFAVYTAHDGNTYLAVPLVTYAIEIINLKTNKVHKTLTGHNQHLFIVRHFYQKKTQTDFLLSTSNERSVKVWNLRTYTCKLTISHCHTGLYLYSALLLFDDANDQSYVVTTCPNEYMKLWDFNTGKYIREIGSQNDYTYFINSWYYKKEYYIINATNSNVRMYKIKQPKELYKEFKTPQSTWHMSAFVEKIKNIYYLFESDGNGYLRVWNIETKEIYRSIQAQGCNLRGICLWNEKYVIGASSDKGFKVINIESGIVESSIKGHDNVLCTVHKIVHPLYGESLVSSGIDGKIKLWTIKGDTTAE